MCGASAWQCGQVDCKTRKGSQATAGICALAAVVGLEGDDVCAAAGLITEQHIKSISVSERPMSDFLCVGPCLFNIAIVVSSANGLSIFPVPMAQSL